VGSRAALARPGIVNDHPEPRELPLTDRKKVLLAIGAAMFALHVIAAIVLAPVTTGAGDANAAAIFALWAASIPWSAVAALLIVRQADLPDIATASMTVTIAPFAMFTLAAAFEARGTSAETNLTDAMFLGVTAGALTGIFVWGIALGVARLLRLPTSANL
jgi:hypothetical protein